MKVAVIGLGNVGLPTALYIHKLGIEVIGYDVSTEAVSRARKNGLDATENWLQVPICDVYVICIYFGMQDEVVNFGPMFEVCHKINERIKSRENVLVAIESTMFPRASRKIYEEVFGKHVKLVHVPHRYWKESPVEHGVRQLRVIGGVDEKSLAEGVNFYENILQIPLHKVPTIEIAEMSKIAENTFRYIQIAFAEELKMICSENPMLDFAEVRRACNTKWNIEIPDALQGIKSTLPDALKGIGEACLPKDIEFFNILADESVLALAAKFADVRYRRLLQTKEQENTV